MTLKFTPEQAEAYRQERREAQEAHRKWMEENTPEKIRRMELEMLALWVNLKASHDQAGYFVSNLNQTQPCQS